MHHQYQTRAAETSFVLSKKLQKNIVIRVDKEPLHYNRSNCESFPVNAPSRRLHKDNFTA